MVVLPLFRFHLCLMLFHGLFPGLVARLFAYFHPRRCPGVFAKLLLCIGVGSNFFFATGYLRGCSHSSICGTGLRFAESVKVFFGVSTPAYLGWHISVFVRVSTSALSGLTITTGIGPVGVFSPPCATDPSFHPRTFPTSSRTHSLTLSLSHSLTLECCAHTQRAHARQHNTKLPRVRGAAVSFFQVGSSR